MYREALALGIAPLFTPLVFLIGSQLVGDESGLSFGGYFVLFGIPAYLVAWLLGFPLAVAFRRLSLQSFWLHIVAGLVLGGAAGHTVDWLFYLGEADWELLVLSWVAGGISAAAYWALAHKLFASVERRDRELYGA